MTAKRRGRPIKVGTLKNPPDYIKSRIIARGGEQSKYWLEVLQDLNAIVEKVEPYRKSLRVKFEEAAVQMNGICELIKEPDILAVDGRLSSMKEIGRKGGKAKGKSTPVWEYDAKCIAAKYSNHSAIRAAELTLESWPKNSPKVPSLRTLRRYIVEQRKKLAK